MAKVEITVCTVDDNDTSEAVLLAFLVEDAKRDADAMAKAIEQVLEKRLGNRGMKLIPRNDTRA